MANPSSFRVLKKIVTSHCIKIKSIYRILSSGAVVYSSRLRIAETETLYFKKKRTTAKNWLKKVFWKTETPRCDTEINVHLS